MKTNRIEKIFEKVKPRKLDVRDRHIALQAVEGWYTVPSFIPENFAPLYKEWQSSLTQLKFTKWLIKNKHHNPDEVAKLGEMLVKETASFKISCRHNDLLRLADTPHYNSCLKSWGKQGAQQFYYLSDPDMALVYVPDKSGKFKWRCLLRLVFNPEGEGFSLLAYRPYGNFNESAVFGEINKILPLYIACGGVNNLGESKMDAKKLFSPTRHNNSLIVKTIWSDHKADLIDQRFSMYGTKW